MGRAFEVISLDAEAFERPIPHSLLLPKRCAIAKPKFTILQYFTAEDLRQEDANRY